MRKKYRELKRKGNVIVFPTTISRLLTEGMNLLKDEQYTEAREKLFQVLAYEPEHAGALGAYAYCLFELGDYEEALDVCRELLKVGPIHYLETMELYISLLMQVREFEEAEQMIQMLIEEKILPEERLQQFQQLQELNERIAANVSKENMNFQLYEAEHFVALRPSEQEQLIIELPPAYYEPLKEKLFALAEHTETDLLTKTYILFMLHQEKVAGRIKIKKFHYEGEFSAAALPDPINNKRIATVRVHLEEALSKDPTRLEMAVELFERHIYLFYPFAWDEFDEREVAEAYMGYLDSLFSGEAPIGMDEALLELIIQAEAWFEFRNG